MRLLMLAPVLALGLMACGKSGDAQAGNSGQAMTAETISSNDVTAIDAVTGEAANMAADVAITADLNNSENAAAPANNGASDSKRAPSRRPATAATAPADAAETPATTESNAQ